ncbi:hypothetical protein ACFQ1E_19155 [Sphingomonas canadensis]|uniref:Uncharacterized protein n=1 Tax=Sphingomonas canadensis TaxID=1219257 RepID=A0ABW3HDF5_9SPHN|nr:hypothetical protein [Sphingomonas canadensis]MCW3838198.1 hypothetical protein [Sphingomonas canadensis]
MTRALVLIDGAAALVGGTGIAMLARPAAAARLMRLPQAEQSAYIVRIVGAMLIGAALFAGGFATVFVLTVNA